MTDNIIKVERKGFNIKIWAKKIGKSIVSVFITGLIITWQDDVKYVLLIPLLKGIANWIKHK